MPNYLQPGVKGSELAVIWKSKALSCFLLSPEAMTDSFEI